MDDVIKGIGKKVNAKKGLTDVKLFYYFETLTFNNEISERET